jgi:hypothetical protein
MITPPSCDDCWIVYPVCNPVLTLLFCPCVPRYDALLGRLTSEVTLRNALDSFPDVRLPAAEMAKDYWQPEVRHMHKHIHNHTFKRYTNVLVQGLHQSSR